MKLASEEKIDTRKVLYGLTALVGAVATIAQALHLIQPGTADNIGQLLGAIGQFLPTAGVTTAAVVLGRQAKTPGMLQPNGSPADQIIAALPAVIDAKAQAEADIDRVKQAAQEALGAVPVIGPLAEQVIASVTR